MSGAGAALRAAAIEALEALELGGVYPGPPLQAAYPYAVVECGPEADWGHKSGRGRELRLAVTLRDSGERPERAQAFAEVVEAAIEAGLDVEGWRLVTLALAAHAAPSPKGAAAAPAGRWRSTVGRGCWRSE